MKNRYWWAAGIAAIILLGIPQIGDSCGPFFATMEFTTYHGLVPADLAAGHPGVVRSHFWRRDLLLSYREFSGVPVRSGDDLSAPSEPAWNRAKGWIEARRGVPGAPPLDQVQPNRNLPGGNFQQYPNCLDGAFTNAAETLKKRIAQWGPASPKTAEWLRGQDQVFQNCANGEAIPAALPGADPDLAADRQYQIAAAEFYSEHYDRAEADFDRIAAQADSPWRAIAPYLAARACLRHATIGNVPAKFEEAAARLNAILKDPAQTPWRESAAVLLDFIHAHTQPQARLVELGNQLLQPDSGPRLSRILTDYTWIWDHLEESKGQLPTAQSDVANWIEVFQHGDTSGIDWSAHHALPWLLSALVWLPPQNASSADLLRAAHAVPPDSPGYASVVYYGVLRQIRAGEIDAARQWAGDALPKTKSQAAVNLLRAERLRMARDWPEFLHFATRIPVGETNFDSADESLSDDDAKSNPVAFDRDATSSLNSATPLDLWIDAAQSREIPARLQSDIAQAGWVRAVLLENGDAARTLARRLLQLKPGLASEMQKYLAETDPAAARFTAVFLMLRTPGLTPDLRPGFPRNDPVSGRDPFRDNWWLLDDKTGPPEPDIANHDALYDLYPGGKSVPPDFLPKPKRTAGEAERSKLLERTANGVNYLCQQAIAWSKSHPRDPRVPQALHQAVLATRYGMTDKSSSAFSKQAFDILHRQYPDSEWTKQTKYWY